VTELGLFDQVGEALRSLVPAELGPLHRRSHRYGVKAWFGAARPARLHYEAQVVGARHVPGAAVLAIEVGLHAEDPRQEENDAALDRLAAAERRWRRHLGPEVVLGPFLGRPEDWRRASETWLDPDLGDPDLPMELSTRLVDYVIAFEPLLRGDGPAEAGVLTTGRRSGRSR
jgi:hypothetical protein